MVFDPDVLSMLRHQAKAALRKRMRALRNSIPERARAARSQKIVERVVSSDLFRRASSIGMFWPMLDRNEVDVRELDALARADGKLVAYPSLLEDAVEMTLRYAEPAELEERGHGFAEPSESSEHARIDDQLLIMVPALAVDPTGQRVGYGKGYYDRLLVRIAPPARTIVVAYDFQIVAEVPVTEGDRPVDSIVTDVRSWDLTPR